MGRDQSAGVTTRDGSGRRLAILAIGDETTASTRLRILAHLHALESAGFVTSVAFQTHFPLRRLVRLPLRLYRELRDLRRASDADILLVQRRCYPPIFTPFLRRRRRPVVLDFDDAIDLPPPSEPQTPRNLRRYRRNFDATVASAELAICGNIELEARVAGAKTVVLPTAVDCERFFPADDQPPDPQTAGWVGHSSNLGFLEARAEPLREIARHHPDFRLVVVSDRQPRIDGVPMEFRRWSLEEEVSNLRGIGIGLMPLEDSPWARGKCAFKLLQYMALGLPSIASPVGMNREIVVHSQNGFLASTDDDWFRCLDSLLGQPDLQRSLGMAGRDTVVRSFDLPVISKRLIGILDRVCRVSENRAEEHTSGRRP
jgi:glycosyltransferase involved in cell wall biosynthesis